MGKTTERLEKIFKDVEDRAKAEDGKSNEEITRLRTQLVMRELDKTRSLIKFFSGFYLIFFCSAIVFFYISVVKLDYFGMGLDLLWATYSLYNLLESYFFIKVYGGRIKLEVK